MFVLSLQSMELRWVGEQILCNPLMVSGGVCREVGKVLRSKGDILTGPKVGTLSFTAGIILPVRPPPFSFLHPKMRHCCG